MKGLSKDRYDETFAGEDGDLVLITYVQNPTLNAHSDIFRLA